VLGRSAAAITHSGFAAAVVREALGSTLHVAVLPAPVFERFCPPQGARPKHESGSRRALDIDALILDSRAHVFRPEGMAPMTLPPPGSLSAGVAPRGTDEPLVIHFDAARCSALLIGFHECESWGVWSSTSEPWLVLPRSVSGRLRISLRASAYGANAARPLTLRLGCESLPLDLGAAPSEQVFEAFLAEPLSVLAFEGIVPERPDGDDSARVLGIGLWELGITPLPAAEPAPGFAFARVVDFSAARTQARLEGFHDPEDWGTWTRDPIVRIGLPFRISGAFRLCIAARALGANIGRELMLRLGVQQFPLVFSDGFEEVYVEGVLPEPCEELLIEGLLPDLSEGGTDTRALGLGLARLRVEYPFVAPAAKPGSGVPGLWVEGCVYVAVLNPEDGRKNWKDILTAFCLTFAEEAHATLIVKVVHTQAQSYVKQLYSLLQRMAPFRCRVLVVHGYIEEVDYRRLLDIADYVVSAARGEGQCLPLMEFMSSGVPAIAPCNSAMRDYHDARSGFVLRSSPEPTFWPQDPRQVFTTLRERIDWSSLAEAFEESFRVRTGEPERYAALSAGAVEAQRRFCSLAALEAPFDALLGALRAREGGQ
jgi:glycosyltransferase involved in cell wall biosynthesis